MGAAETRRAIEAAAAALPAWRARPARERAAILRGFSDLMLRHRRDLAMIMTREQGKPLAESDAEIGYAASFLEWFGEEAKRVYGDTIPAAADRHAHRRAQAAGRRLRRHHALELPVGDDHAQGRARAGRRQHDRLQARRADAALGARAGRARRPRGHPAGRLPDRHRRRRGRAGDRRRADRQPDRAQDRRSPARPRSASC